jgi:hypothetical protein
LEHVEKRHQKKRNDNPEGEISKVVHGHPFLRANPATGFRGPTYKIGIIYPVAR